MMNDSISNAIKRYNHLCSELDTAYHEMSYALGLSDSAMIVLYTICCNGSRCLLREICGRSGLSKQTINSALRKLEKDGIIRLEPADAKSKNVCLTEEGQRLADRTARRMMKAENEIFASWTQEDVQTFLRLTEQFLDALREKTRRLKEESGI